MTNDSHALALRRGVAPVVGSLDSLCTAEDISTSRHSYRLQFPLVFHTRGRPALRHAVTMGIPRLLSLLEPYGEHVSVTSDDSSDKHKTNVIIDGPAFAFHIYDICLALTPNARNAFEALPSYKLLGDVAIQWLNQLESFPFRMYAYLASCRSSRFSSVKLQSCNLL